MTNYERVMSEMTLEKMAEILNDATEGNCRNCPIRKECEEIFSYVPKPDGMSDPADIIVCNCGKDEWIEWLNKNVDETIMVSVFGEVLTKVEAIKEIMLAATIEEQEEN